MPVSSSLLPPLTRGGSSACYTYCNKTISIYLLFFLAHCRVAAGAAAAAALSVRVRGLIQYGTCLCYTREMHAYVTVTARSLLL